MKKRVLISAVLAVSLLAGALAVGGRIGGSGRPVGSADAESEEAADTEGAGATNAEIAEASDAEIAGGTDGAGADQALTASEAVAAAADGNWGLSFQNEGKAPVGNATVEYLKQFDAWYIDDGGSSAGTGDKDGTGGKDSAEKCIYLTFDAGYENGYTEKILNVLKEEKVPAAFFLVGNYITENPDLVKRMVREGHIVGNHTMHHPDMSVIAAKEDFEKELKDLEAVYKETTGKTMKKFYRPPQGKYSETNLMQAHEMGYQTIFWSLAYVDWYEDQQPTREEALNILNKRIHPGAIVLLHSTSKTNGEIMQELIRGWKQQGYVFKSLENM